MKYEENNIAFQYNSLYFRKNKMLKGYGVENSHRHV